MEVGINYIVFEGNGFPMDESLINNLGEDETKLVKEMMVSGYYQDGLDISKFLESDLTVAISKLALATTLAVHMLEANSNQDITLFVRNLEEYFKLRNVNDDEKQKREEKLFLMTFITREALEASKCDTLVVKFV